MYTENRKIGQKADTKLFKQNIAKGLINLSKRSGIIMVKNTTKNLTSKCQRYLTNFGIPTVSFKLH